MVSSCGQSKPEITRTQGKQVRVLSFPTLNPSFHSFSSLVPSSSEGGRSGSWLDSSAIRLWRFSSPTTNAFFTPAFNACAVSPTSAGSPDINPSLLHYTRCRLPLSVSSSFASNSPDPHSMARKHLHWLLHLRSSLSSLLSSSPLSYIIKANISRMRS